MRVIGMMALMGFAVFVAFRIFTPPTKVVQVISAPDGRREARLMLVYYSSEPGYKIAVRKGWGWHTLLYIPEYQTGKGEPQEAALHWSSDSTELIFEINDEQVWGWNFSTQSSLSAP